MKALVVVGGHRKKNTWWMATSFAEGLMEAGYETEWIRTAATDIRPCIGCEACRDFLGCIQKDGMQHLYETIEEARVVVIATPLYFFSYSSDVKAWIDRCQPFWERTFRRQEKHSRAKERKGILLANQGGPFQTNAFEAVEQTARTLFRAMQVANTMFYGLSNTDRHPVEERTDILVELQKLGRNLDAGCPLRLHRG